MLLTQTVAGLFLDPGLGKTVICLSAFMILHKKGLAKKMLIIAPLRPVYKVWPDEIKKWDHTAHLTYTILHGPDKNERLKDDVNIYIINPEGLQWLYGRPHPQFDILCIDESSKFRDTQTKRFKLLKPFFQNFARRWILTGTPAPNGLEGLFGQIYILDLGRSLGRYITHFRTNFFMRSPWNVYEWLPRQGAFQEVVEKISPLVLQLSSEDYLKMPTLVLRQISVTLPPPARKVYDDVENSFFSALEEGNIVASSAAVAGVKCRQVANGAVYDEFRKVLPVHEEKLEALESLLEELNGAPCLVLYEFIHDLERIQTRIGPLPNLGSGTSTKQMEGIIDKFNAGSIPTLLGHPRSMGHGLNLQGSCHHVIWFGITWDLELYDQAIARVYRQGQQKDKVFVYSIVAKDTLDERVVAVLGKKDKEQQKLLKALSRHRKEHYDPA